MTFLLSKTMKQSIKAQLHKKACRRNDVASLYRNQSTTAELRALISKWTLGIREHDAAIGIFQNWENG